MPVKQWQSDNPIAIWVCKCCFCGWIEPSRPKVPGYWSYYDLPTSIEPCRAFYVPAYNMTSLWVKAREGKYTNITLYVYWFRFTNTWFCILSWYTWKFEFWNDPAMMVMTLPWAASIKTEDYLVHLPTSTSSHWGMLCWEDPSFSTILLIGKSPVLTSLLVQRSPHWDLPPQCVPLLILSLPLAGTLMELRHVLSLALNWFKNNLLPIFSIHWILILHTRLLAQHSCRQKWALRWSSSASLS
jgi:hypothetical protein